MKGRREHDHLINKEAHNNGINFVWCMCDVGYKMEIEIEELP